MKILSSRLFVAPRGVQMEERVYALLGIAAFLVAYTSIGVSIILSPWFSWQENALSDLGHSTRSRVAPIFNLGLLAAGALFTIYAVTAFRRYAKYTSVSALISAFTLQSVATFDEVYGFLHFVVSVLLFASLGVTSILYAVERKSLLALIAFAVGLGSWILYWLGTYHAGIAVPETLSSLAVAVLIVSSAVKIYLKR
ncbi:hypothetical protein DRO29_03875 [Candidatus Bathyarchaeota archaeon]|nr:MAG: hypothetical protein DRO29_03875 [Candidatus Bathyarchaeota archaeon]